MCRVLCIGHAAYDIIYISDGFIKEDKKYETDSFSESGGGPAANAAFLLSTWGIKTAFAGIVGNDDIGSRIINEFKSSGTDTALMEQADCRTHLSFIITNKRNGSRTIINRKDKESVFNINIKKLSTIKPEILLFDGHEPAASEAAVKLFPDAVSILDAGSLRTGTKLLMDSVNYLAASEKFALSLTGLKDLKTAENRTSALQALSSINKNSCITLGKHGVIYMKDNSLKQIKALSVNTVDTTGAGDIFHGAFAYCILNKMSFEEALEFSGIAAGLSVRNRGGRKSIPALEEVFKYYRK